MKVYDPLTEKQIENFYKKIKKTENDNDCWEWNSRIDRDGYGEFRYDQKGKRYYRLAHRVALQLTNVDVNPHLVLHSCDNRKCCNPKHLRTGTHQENMNDMKERGRSLKGKKKVKPEVIINNDLQTQSN
jgi:hypothetical protein